MQFFIWKSSDDQFYFELQADNGETVAVSELYRHKQSAERTIAAIKRGAGAAHTYDMTDGSKYDRHLP